MNNVLGYTRELEEVGFSKRQAETSIEIWMDMMNQNLATKADFKEHYFMAKADLNEMNSKIMAFNFEIKAEMDKFKSEIRTEINEFKSEIRAELNSLQFKLLTRIGGMMAATMGIGIAIMGYLK